MNTRRHVVSGIFTAAVLVTASVLAEGREDFYAQFSQQRFFDHAQNARTLGMAGSSIVTSSDSSSVLGNPAGLGFMKDAEVSATYTSDEVSGNDARDYSDIEQDIDRGHVLGAFPIVPTLDGTPRYGNIGFGWSGERSEVDDSYQNESKGYGLHAAYGKDVSATTSLGYSFDYIYDRISGTISGYDVKVKMSDGVRQSVGIQHRTSADTTLGFSTFYGFGQRDYDVTSDDSISEQNISSWGASFGAGHKMGATLLAGEADYVLYSEDSDDDFYVWSFRTGIEQTLTEWLKGRVGYRYQALLDYDGSYGNDNSKYNAFSLGAGVQLMKSLVADYGTEFRWVGDGSDWTHSVSLTVPFSICE